MGVFRRLWSLLFPPAAEAKRHPGVVHDGRTEISRPGRGANPHLLSWLVYADHLDRLTRDGHAKSPAADQVRTRLSFHWRFMSAEEREEALTARAMLSSRVAAHAAEALSDEARKTAEMLRRADDAARQADNVIRMRRRA